MKGRCENHQGFFFQVNVDPLKNITDFTGRLFAFQAANGDELYNPENNAQFGAQCQSESESNICKKTF